MQFIDIYDFLLLPVYVFLFYWIIIIRAKKMESADQRKYFNTAFLLHISGSFLYCLVIQYYYGYGDSFGFYMGSNFLRKTIHLDGNPLNTITMTGDDFLKRYTLGGFGDLELPTGIQSASNLVIMKVSALLSYISFNSYVVISLFFGLFAFAGAWRLFSVFSEILEKRSEKILAYSILYMPSICFWGSGLMKDSLCLGFVGFIVHGVYKLFVRKEISIREIILTVVCFYLLFLVKSYIASVLAVSCVLAYVLQVLIKSKGNIIKLSLVIVILLVSAAFVAISASSNMESIIEESKSQIEVFKGSYANASNDDERSVASFTTSDFDFSLSGLILRSPMAIFTTLFRPFLWETRKPIMFFSALESFLTLLATIYILLKCRVVRFFRYLVSDPFIFFAFIFVILLAAIVGFTTFNFGTLVRYRLPVLPFYYFLLLSIYLRNKKALLSDG